jgi:hypothetical protein
MKSSELPEAQRLEYNARSRRYAARLKERVQAETEQKIAGIGNRTFPAWTQAMLDRLNQGRKIEIRFLGI